MNPNELISKLDYCLTALSKGNSQLKILGIKKSKNIIKFISLYKYNLINLKSSQYEKNVKEGFKYEIRVIYSLFKRKWCNRYINQ